MPLDKIMKNSFLKKYSSRTRYLLFFVLSLIINLSYGQSYNFYFSLENEHVTNSTDFSFDLYITNTGTNIIDIGGVQWALSLNRNFLNGNGTINTTILQTQFNANVINTSDFTSLQTNFPAPLNYLFRYNKYFNGATQNILANTKVLVAKFQISNSTGFNLNLPSNVRFKFGDTAALDIYGQSTCEVINSNNGVIFGVSSQISPFFF